jgi:hypothetical protein
MPEEKTLLERPPGESKGWGRLVVPGAGHADAGFIVLVTAKNVKAGKAEAQSSKASQPASWTSQQQLLI